MICVPAAQNSRPPLKIHSVALRDVTVRLPSTSATKGDARVTMKMPSILRLLLTAAFLLLLGAGSTVLALPASAENASNGYPYCANGSSSDPDGDGWGWENNASCVVKGSRADPGAGSGSGSGNGSGSGSTTSCPSGATCGSYSVSGLGYRKQQILNAGGNVLDVATAMLETDTMQTNYAYGDYKTYDAANFGIFKQNWGMLRVSCSQFRGQSQNQWNNGAALNSNLGQDISCLHQSQSYYGVNTWFAGHRNGSSGLSNPNTSDINAYRTAVYWIRDQLSSNSANLYNDTRFWVNVPAI
jgi:hypothetical protein